MTKNAVLTTYNRLLNQMSDKMVDAVEEEFGGRFLGKVAKRGATAMMGRIESEMQEQGRIVIEYADEVEKGNEDTTQYEEQFLSTNPVYKRYDGNQKEELRNHLLSHFKKVGSDLAPLIASEQDDFWKALRNEYSRAEAEQILDRHFNQAEMFKKYRGGVFSSEIIANRVISIVETAEKQLQEEIHTELDQVYQ